MTTWIVMTKDGVKFDRISPAGFCLLAAIHTAAQRLKRNLVITSGTDSHSASDPHGQGSAYDVSVNDMPEATILAMVTGLRMSLGPLFTVLYETKTPVTGALAMFNYANPHATAAHVHLQPVKGTVYPPGTMPV